MVLTQEENDLFTHVGPGTPAGELLRRYWLPVAFASELSEEQPTKFVRILCEDLVLFRDKSGRYGLVQDHCPHRGASLMYGRVEERGISCAYHGWLFDTSGSCLECPAEPAGSMFHLTVKARAYPVQKLVGLLWAYLGPEPAPLIPPYDVWVRKDGTHRVGMSPRLDCNWFQAMENSADPAHLQILHQNVSNHGREPTNTTRGFTDDIDHFDFYEVPYGGLMKRRFYKNGMVDEHPILFPNILRVNQGTQIRVPIDDEHTLIFNVAFQRSPDGSVVEEPDPPFRQTPSYKTPPDGLYPFVKMRVDDTNPQDHMAWETQGPIANRTVERLATSDRGVVMYREMIKREIERMLQGHDPLGVVRDPSIAEIDTGLQKSLEEYVGKWRGPLDEKPANWQKTGAGMPTG
jgi:5,5'-dehydrodivanillate O-demethylase